MRNPLKSVTAGLLLVVSLATARAQKPEGERSERTGIWGIGAGLVYSSSPYEGDDDTAIPIPFISYFGEHFYITGIKAGYRFAKGRSGSAAVVAKGRFDGYEEDDSSVFGGMDDRDRTLDAGLDARWNLGRTTSIGVAALTDVFGVHEGQEVSISLQRRIFGNAWMLTPSVGASWLSAELADYYYGVLPSEAIPSRPAYDVGNAINVQAGANLLYFHSDTWSFTCGGGVELLDGDIEDSPIVGKDVLFRAVLGAIYLF